jgi:prepilin-type processing-associated H-X9-DG protein
MFQRFHGHLASRTGSQRPFTLREAAAFTLVELLVVIGIIALLIAILMPSLRRARQSAQGVACMSNQRQIGVSMLQYLHDGKGQYMDAYSPAKGAWYRWLVSDPEVWPNNARGYLPGYDIFFCPAHEIIKAPTRWPVLPGETDRQYAVSHGLISYGINMSLSSNPATIPPIPPAKFTQLKKPSETILMMDTEHPVNKYGLFYVHPYYIPANANVDYGGPALRHPNLTVNVLWADGHVTAVGPARRLAPYTIYDRKALTDSGMTPNLWDRQ